ncbi:ATP-dependent DNA helicase RecG [Salinibacter ruber]|uniref:ATP-binding protein n=1 Tax=Salinibacter ruber TaxID=146919 RepID=UPI002166CD81|nr:ATP-binding protein [Salinibacter ruber]MCS3751351.1 ATP-dependent DNA helicase RecG [Salinibacter ruber]
MTTDEVRDIVEGGETAQVEFKRSTGQRIAAAKAVCGMLNGKGGYVLFGVKDDGTIVGQEVSDSTRQDVARELGKIEPQVVLDPDVVPVEGERSVIVISVPGDRRGPYAYDGRPYVRQGPTTRPMEQSAYEARLVENRDPRRRWEARPAQGVAVEDLDASEITRTISAAIDRGRMEEPGTRDPEDLLRGLGLIQDGQILNAAVVLFGEDDVFMPDYPQCLLRMARFRGTTKSEFEDNRQVRANAFTLFQRAQQFLREHLPIASTVRPDAMEREDTPLYPMEALREALANALCHRDYGLRGSSIGLAIYDDRLEITNTGTLPLGITLDELTQPHVSQLRNDLIADTFYRRGIIEQWGRGTIMMREATEEAGLVPPEFEERGGEIVVRFRPIHYVPPTRVEHDLTNLQREILKVVAKEQEAALSEVLEELGDVPRRTVQDNLQTLRSIDLVELEGRGAGARWRLVEDSDQAAGDVQ